MAVIRMSNRIDTPNTITAYMNCKQCIHEKPDSLSAAEWARTNVGITKDGHIQVWCVRHNTNVAFFDLTEFM